MLIICCSFIGTVYANGEEDLRFEGSRTLVCTFDRSDLNNFIDGGSAAFEEMLKELDTNWSTCSIEKMKRDMKVTISFSFNSKDEYESRMKDLLGYRPVVIYQTSDNFIFAENFESGEMLNVVQNRLLSEGMLSELKFDSLLNVEVCTMILNGTEYTTTDNFDVRNNNSFKYDDLDIMTVAQNDGSFERTIKVGIKSDNLTAEIKNAVTNNFAASGDFVDKSGNGENFSAEVNIKAANNYELSRKTLLASGVTISTIENEIAEQDFVRVNCTEKIGIKKVVNESGDFTYDYTYPAYYKDLQIEEADKLSLTDNRIKYSGEEGKFEYSYQRGLKLFSLKIITKCDNIIKGIDRTIILAVPKETANVFDAKLSDALNLIKEKYKGTQTSSEIDGENKLYLIEYYSHKEQNIAEFTQSVLKGGCQIEYHNSLLPFSRNKIAENMRVGSIINNMIPVSEVECIYNLPKKSIISESGNVDYTFYDNEYSSVISASGTINIQYKTFNIIVIAVAFATLLLFAVLIILVVIKIKKKMVKIKSALMNKPNKNKKFCTKCGSEINGNVNFCTKCGEKIE